MGPLQRRFWVLWAWLAVLLASVGAVLLLRRGARAAARRAAALSPELLTAIETFQRAERERALREAGTRWLPDVSGGATAGTIESEGLQVGWRVLSREKPRVLILQPFVTPDEATELMRLAEPRLARSQVVDSKNGSGKVDGVRTSEGAFIGDGEQARSKALNAVRRRVAAVMSLPVSNIEPTQILRYRAGERYLMHPDFFVGPKKEKMGPGGQRIATCIAWLNNVSSGGATRFNSVPSIVVRPQTFGAVLFYSVDRTGKEDGHSMHEGQPPKEGASKWVAVHWVRRGTMLRSR
eukprot:TRINITY_DN11432_c0_g2_i1.p1 TRINITY_DN11432_c0_g2~~TRINITY_DN11432_c0_g2_i1.p1  ORF type:complete len:327 (+),score=84.04 TRINITY_DN11432_c0_g2_i1:101-982(+)